MLETPCGDPLPRLLTTAQAREVGFTPQQVRTELGRNRWQVLTRGVYLTRPVHPQRSDWIMAGLSVAGPGSALSGWDAVRARGIGSVRPPVSDVLVLATGGTHRRIGHAQIRPSHRPLETDHVPIPETLVAVPMATVGRAVADTALVYRRFNPVRALVTEAVQRRLCTPEELSGELDAGPQNGSAHLRRAIEDVFLGVESIAEAELADIVRCRAFPTTEYNVPIVTWDGRHVATADALWRELRAGLEVDSKKHHFQEEAWYGTMRRHNRLTRRGLSVTHYAPREIRADPAAVGAEVEEWLRTRARELGVTYTVDRVQPIRPQLHVPFVLPRPPTH